MKDAEAAHGLGPAADDALESQPILDGTQPGSSSGGGGGGREDDSLQLPLSPRSRWRAWKADPLVRAAAVNLGLILTWYTFSTLLSLFNKIIVGQEHGLMGLGAFPAPFLMSSTQFFMQHLIARAVLACRCVRRSSDGNLSWRDYFKKVVPNGVATGLDIGLSNYSLVFITPSFYVMCKSTTPLFLLVFAIAWGIEKPSWSLAAVVSVITAGLLLLVYGETKFHLVGFLLVMAAAMLAGLRWTITQVLLQGTPGSAHGSRKHGGPVEVLHQLTPVMGLTLLILSLAHERLWVRLPASPYFANAWMVLLSLAIIFAGALIAFAMVVAEFALIANTSALTFMVAGTFKEIVTVAAAVLFLGESFTWVNGMGLLVLIAGVVLFNYLKYQKLKSDLHLGQPVAGVGGGGKASDGAELAAAAGGDGGCSSGSGSEVELSSGGGGGLVRQPSGGAEHQTLMLGIRQGFLVEEEQLLRQGSHGSAVPWRPETMRSRAPSPPGSLQTQRSV